MSLFVDTGVWFAAVDAGDRHHRRATEILGRDEELLVTDHIVIESWRLIAHRLGAGVADRFAEEIVLGAATLQIVTAADLSSALAVRGRYPDQSFSLVDCTSFAVMERLRLRRVAAFDDDFAIYRFGRRAAQAFEVVR